MAKRHTNIQLKNDQFTKIFDEYRAKIDEIAKKTTDKNLQQYDKGSQYLADSEEEKQEEIATRSKAESNNLRAEVELQASKQASEIIKEAKLQAKQLLDEAEERIKKEARKKTQAQVDRIIERTSKESEELISRARQAAEKERGEIIASSKQEVEQLIKEITEKCREETQAQSSQIITEAREKAEKIINDVVTNSAEISKTVMEIMKKAKKTINEFENEIQTGVSELEEAISEAENMLEQVTTGIFEKGENDIETVIAPSGENVELIENTVLSVSLMGEQSKGKNGGSPLFTGQVELKSVSSFEYRHLKNLMNYLVHIPGIKYVQENASEKEMSVLFNVKEPLPLLDIFSEIPLVDKVVSEGDDISLVLKNHTLVSEGK